MAYIYTPFGGGGSYAWGGDMGGFYPVDTTGYGGGYNFGGGPITDPFFGGYGGFTSGGGPSYGGTYPIDTGNGINWDTVANNAINAAIGGGGGGGQNPNPLAQLLGLAGMGLGAYGGFSALQLMQDLRGDRNTAAGNVLSASQNNSLPPGLAAATNQAALEKFLGIGDSMNGSTLAGMFAPQMGNFFGQMNQYGQNILPHLTTPSNPAENPYFSSYYQPNMDQIMGSYSTGINGGLGNFLNNGITNNSQNLFNNAFGMSQGNNPYMRTLGDVGGYYLQNGGANAANAGAMGTALNGLVGGGWDPQSQSLFNSGMGFANQGGSMVANGGANPFLSNLAATGLTNMNQFSSADPASFLGSKGNSFLNTLAGNPMAQQGFGQASNFGGQIASNFGYSPQDQTTFNYALPTLAQDMGLRNDQLTQAFNTAMGAANGNLDSLPDWFSQMSSKMPGLNGGISLPSIGGGGFQAASAPTASRDIGADARKSLDMFYQNPLLTNEYAMTMADNAARTAGIQQAQQAARQAQALGGPGAVVANGAGNQAIKQMADQIMQNRANAQMQALMNQQTLANNRANTAAGLGQGMANMFMNANIADANNATQASTANASASAAVNGQNIQAQIANAQNQLGLAQLLSGNYQALLNSATNLRGQNVQSQVAGLNNLSGLTNSANQRDAILAQLLQSGGQNATQNMGTAGGVISGLPNFSNAFTNQMTGALNPLVAGQQTGTQRAGIYGDLLNNTTNNMTGMAGIGGSLVGTGLNAAGTAGGLANNRFANNTGLFNIADQSQLGRMTLGGNLTNSMLNNQVDWGRLGQSNVDSTNSFALGSGNMAGNFINGQNSALNNSGNFYLGLGNQDLANRQGAAGMFSNYFSGYGSAFNPLNAGIQTSYAPYQRVYDQTMSYLGNGLNLMSPYANMMSLGPMPQNVFANMIPQGAYRFP